MLNLEATRTTENPAKTSLTTVAVVELGLGVSLADESNDAVDSRGERWSSAAAARLLQLRVLGLEPTQAGLLHEP